MPGQIKESCRFTASLKDFEKLNAVVVSVSVLDPNPKSRAGHCLRHILLNNEANAVCEKHGVWTERSSHGKTCMGVSRETFVISPDGKIAMHWPKAARSEEHPAEVLAWLKAKG